MFIQVLDCAIDGSLFTSMLDGFIFLVFFYSAIFGHRFGNDSLSSVKLVDLRDFVKQFRLLL